MRLTQIDLTDNYKASYFLKNHNIPKELLHEFLGKHETYNEGLVLDTFGLDHLPIYPVNQKAVKAYKNFNLTEDK